MNTFNLSETITQGVAEVSLERADQLQPGVLLSGTSAQHVWQVLDALSQREETDEGWIRLRQWMRGVRMHSHQWKPRGEGAVECTACGLRRQRVSDLLPVSTPRAVVVIPPPGVVNAIQSHTLYATTSGQIVTTIREGQTRLWRHYLPIVPYLRPIWTLPAALAKLIEGGTAPANREQETPADPAWTVTTT